jgi:beta-lactam-binding protein with PASTA domain
MTIWWLVLILAALGSVGIAFIWLAVRVGGGRKSKNPIDNVRDAADQDVEHLFDANFREELRNRGRLHFEKIIGESAMFLQQDLRLTTSQLNEYMKGEITAKLHNELETYESAIEDAKNQALEAIKKTNTVIEEQRKEMSNQVQQEVQQEKQEQIIRFEKNMADIINHYVLAAVGDQIDLSDQLEYILGEFERNKTAIMEDLNNGV